MSDKICDNDIAGNSGVIFDIKRFAIHDGLGIRTTVFFKGCPLHCAWCHNPESWRSDQEVGFQPSRCIACGECVDACPEQAITLDDNVLTTDTAHCTFCGDCVLVCMPGAREVIGYKQTADEVVSVVQRDIPFYDQSGGGVTFSGGEPLMQTAFLVELLDRCKQKHIHTCIDTTCYAKPEDIQSVIPLTDLFLCDIKHMDSQKHRSMTGVDNDIILENLKRLASASKTIYIRVPIVPGFNDDNENIAATADFVRSLGVIDRIDILPYNSGGTEKSSRLFNKPNIRKFSAPSQSDMDRIAEYLRGLDFQVAIRG